MSSGFFAFTQSAPAVPNGHSYLAFSDGRIETLGRIGESDESDHDQPSPQELAASAARKAKLAASFKQAHKQFQPFDVEEGLADDAEIDARPHFLTQLRVQSRSVTPRVPEIAHAMFSDPPKKKSVSFGLFNYMWFRPESMLAFHASVRLKHGEALLVDCGAVGNLAGSSWVSRTSEEAKQAGRGTRISPLKKPINIGGVGKNDQVASELAEVPLAFENGMQSLFKTPIVPNSEIPALLGLELIDAHSMVIDSRNNRLIIPGAGGYRMELSPGSVSLKLHRAMSGHLMLPCTAWKTAKPGAKQIMLQ
jgi:hypothetical protein